ncbi:MAG: ROK family protein [Chitinophagales bacterium]|nr:ROK family protein [Chitinophagales bacterium]
MAKKVVVGIDIGGTGTKYGIVDKKGNILLQETARTPDFKRAEDFAHVISASILQLVQKLKGVELVGAGIGSPNGNYYSGTVEFAPNLPWKGIVPLASHFKEALHLPVVLTNDAKAAAIGEMLFGGAKNMKHFIFITLGTGLGSGIVSNGALVYGHDGFAGEMGHTIIKENSNRLCGCGRYGCLETYASATGIRKSYMKFLAEKDRRAPIEPEKITAAFIYEKAKEGDEEALTAFNYTGHILGIALANAVTYLSPEAIFLFGGLAQSGELIFKPTRDSFEENLLKIYRNKIKILPSLLNDGDAAILGAASIIWHELR